MARRFMLAVPLGLVALGCSHARPAAAPARTPGPASALHWVRSSAEYRALCLQTYAFATRQVESAARDLRRGTWGVILDADETVLDNSDYQKQLVQEGHGYSEDSWAAWVRRRQARETPGARAFLERVQALGGVVAIVTNRAQALCEDTRQNLRALGLGVDVVLCKADPTSSEKEARFESLLEGTTAFGLPPLKIVGYVGDNMRDFPGWTQAARGKPETELREFGTRYFLLPNPMYGSWENNPER